MIMIKSIEKSSVHRITSGQVLVDLQTAVKELVENSLDAGATSIEVRFKDYGLKSFEVIDNGSGISPEDYDNVAMKHCTSKLSTFEDLTTVQTFGFRGEALSSLCALSERVTITTATAKEAPMGTVLEFDRIGKLKSQSGKAARQRGTTVFVEGLFTPLPVRRKEFERNSKREFGKALSLLSAYALVPCTKENRGVRLIVVHHQEGGRKSNQLRTDGKPSLKASISSLWGPKQFESLAELSLDLEVVPEKMVLRRQGELDHHGLATKIQVRGFISKFLHGNGRAGPDRQFFFINGRPCNPTKIQKAFNEVYRTFNVSQSPFIVADFILPTNSCDINVSPDKRTILLHSENALVTALKDALERAFAPSRSTFVVQSTQTQMSTTKNLRTESSGKGSASSQDAAVETQGDVVINEDVEVTNPAESDVLEGQSTQESLPFVSETPASLSIDDVQTIQESSLISTETAPQRASPSSCLRSPSPAVPKAASSSDTCPRPRHPVSASSAAPASAKPTAQPIQMVLGTLNASWAMQRASEEPARKKRKIEASKGMPTAKPRAAFRSQLVSFAAAGVGQCDRDEEEEEDVEMAGDEDENEGEDNNVDDLVDEELEEMRMDANVDAMEENSPGERATSSHKAASNLNEIVENADDPPLFLPELGERIIPPKCPRSSRDKVEEIDVGVRTDDSSSALNAERAAKTCTMKGSLDVGDASASTSVVSASTGVSRRSESVEILRTASDRQDERAPFDLERIELAWSSLLDKPTASTDITSPKGGKVSPSAGISNASDEASAERELSRVIDKEDFATMEILGQFNLGFIIARRCLRRGKSAKHVLDESTDHALDAGDDRNSVGGAELDDLFIIDQHAADEKFNFETLQQTTKIESQKLYQARPLELTAADELLALENIDVLKSNGFEISIDEDAEASQGRIKLVAQPVSGSTSFDMRDLEELLHLMQDRPAGQKMVRCSKARAMFAMRACRKSVMIGMALNKTQMASVVRHMGTMDQPWNCPHGRPTMRHLVSLNDTTVGACEQTSRLINWGDL